MKLKKEPLENAYRVAVILDVSSGVAQRMLDGLYRRATSYPNLQVRRFFSEPLTVEGIDGLINWQPDALVIYWDDTAVLQNIRTALPHTPVVAMNHSPHGIVDMVVTGNGHELIKISLDHFFNNGLTHYAMFYGGDAESARRYADDFYQNAHVQSGTFSYFHRNVNLQEILDAPSDDALKTIGDWLERLPKPVGIFSPTDHSIAYLMRICSHFGLAIPKDVQLIGCDELDESLECLPHITSIHLPARRIGSTSLENVIARLKGKQTQPSILLVDGASLIPLGSTGILPSKISNIPAAIAYIESNAVQGLSAEEVFQETQSVSLMTFYRDFKNATGELPAVYIRRVRLDTACRLLSTTQLDITRITELSGFSSGNYFAQIFRRETGMTPSQYRASHQKAT